MAIFKPSAIIAAISGKLGGQVFVQARGANVVRHRPAGKGGASRRHEIPKRNLAEAQRFWKTLTDDQHAAWRTFAVQYPVTNRIGLRRPLSPYQAFVRTTLNRFLFGLTPTELPPLSSPYPFPASVSLTTFSGGGVLAFANPNPNPDSYRFLAYAATLPRNTLPNSGFRNWRFLNSYSTFDGAFSLTDDWLSAWGLPRQDQAIALRIDTYRIAGILAHTVQTQVLTDLV